MANDQNQINQLEFGILKPQFCVTECLVQVETLHLSVTRIGKS